MAALVVSIQGRGPTAFLEILLWRGRVRAPRAEPRSPLFRLLMREAVRLSAVAVRVTAHVLLLIVRAGYVLVTAIRPVVWLLPALNLLLLFTICLRSWNVCE